MEIRFIPLVVWAIAVPIAHGDESPATAQGVLHPPNHPKNAEYISVYSGSLTPIDEKISWVNRFKGDARFNTPQQVDSINQTPGNSRQASTSVGGFDATGIVKKIDQLTQKVKLAHGPIEHLGMPAMTMVFKTSDTSLLNAAEVGQEVGFNVTETDAGFVVTSLAPLNVSSVQPAGDGHGVIKSIRNGKVKLKHGPIEKYGMPGMTMMFKTADPSMLDGLETGAEVEFDVESTDSGFTITRIKTLKGDE